MTMLLSTCTDNYVLSTTDMRVSRLSGQCYSPIDEKFNKHILYTSQSFSCDITYTGVAEWTQNGCTTRLYDIISHCAARCAKDNVTIAELLIALTVMVKQTLDKVNKFGVTQVLELHMVGFHRECPWPFLGCISSSPIKKPWLKSTETEWHWTIYGLEIFLAFRDTHDVMVGGITSALTSSEKLRILHAAERGANAFNLANLCAKYIEHAATRDARVGSRSVSLVIPINGMIDTNLWDRTESGIIGFLPSMIFANGQVWPPSEFPVDLQVITEGHLPPDNIFFRSIVYKTMKRSIVRRIFRRKKGKKVPGILGLVMLGIFGNITDEYETFGLDSAEDIRS